MFDSPKTMPPNEDNKTDVINENNHENNNTIDPHNDIIDHNETLTTATTTNNNVEVSISSVEVDAEIAELSALRCSNRSTEEIANREKKKRRNRCADYPGLAFGSAAFGSETMMK